MSTLSWPELRHKAITAFNGELPHPQTEQEIIDRFEQAPLVVIRAVDRISDDLAGGAPIRSCWAVLRKRINDNGPLSTATVQLAATADRNVRVRNAERWMRNVGLHYDRWEQDCHDDLFGHLGTLKDWANDQALVQRMHTLWLELRPLGEQYEQERDHWFAGWRQREHERATRQRQQVTA